MTPDDISKAPENYADYEAWARGTPAVAEQQPTEEKPSGAEAEPVAKPTAVTAPNSEAEDDKDQELTDKPPSKGGFQRRIDKLTAQIHALEAQVASKQSPTEPPTGAAPPQPQQAGEPKLEEFPTYEAYNKALVKWAIAQDREAQAAEHAQAQRQQAEAKANQDWQGRLDAFTKSTPDFAEVLAEANVPLPAAMREAIITSEHGPEVAYHLAQNLEETQRIAGLSPVAQVRELGKLEAKFEAGKIPDHTEKPKPAKTPNPIKPVSAGSKDVPRLDGDIKYEEYERLRQAEIQRSTRFRG